MADPREDAYLVAALLSELERVLHPLPRGQRGEVRPETMLPPPLPPPTAPASSRGGQPSGTAGGGVAFAAPTPRLPGEDVPRAGLSRFPLPAAAPPTGARFDEGPAPQAAGEPAWPAAVARAGQGQDVAESGRAATGETPAKPERGEASVHAKDFPGLAESPRPSGRAEQPGPTATAQTEGAEGPSATPAGARPPGAAQPAPPAIRPLAAPARPPVPGPPGSLDILISQAPEAGEKPPARPPRLPLPPSPFRAPDGAKALTPQALAGTPAAGQEPATAPPMTAAPAAGRALPSIPVAAEVLPFRSQRPHASPKDAELGRGGRQAPASAEADWRFGDQSPGSEAPFQPDGSEPERTFDDPAASARQDRLAEGQATAVPPAGPSGETEASEFGEALLEPAETALPPPARRQPGGRLALRLTAAEALRLDRRVKGAYLDRALLRCQ